MTSYDTRYINFFGSDFIKPVRVIDPAAYIKPLLK